MQSIRSDNPIDTLRELEKGCNEETERRKGGGGYRVTVRNTNVDTNIARMPMTVAWRVWVYRIEKGDIKNRRRR